MLKLVLILLMGLFFEAIGVVCLSQGLKQIGEFQQITVGEVLRVFRAALANRNIMVGMVFETAFFGSLVYLMSQSSVSFIWPLSSLGLVLTTLAARFVLREQVSALRWGGVLLMVLGAGVIIYTEKVLEKKPPARPAPPSAANSRE